MVPRQANSPADSPRENLLDDVRVAEQTRTRAERELDDAVLSARSAGCTWQEIGEVLGISRQAAFKRFGRPVDPQTQRVVATGRSVDPVEVVESVFRLIAAGDYDALRERMTYACSRELTRNRVASVWRDVLAEVGELESFTRHRTATRDGHALPQRPQPGPFVAQVVLCHEAGELAGHVSVNRSGKVDGIVMAPLSAAATLPF